VRDLAYPLALAIVVAVPLAASGVLALLAMWARWLLEHGGPTGRRGLWATFAVTAGGLVWLTVEDERTARSVLARLEVAGLVGLAVSLAVVLRVRRSGRDAGAPGAPIR
jgi:hypothetical protein